MKPTHLVKIPEGVKVGDKFKTKVENTYCGGQVFPAGSVVTFMGVSEIRDCGLYFYTAAHFQYEGDDHKQRMFDFDKDLEKIN